MQSLTRRQAIVIVIFTLSLLASIASGADSAGDGAAVAAFVFPRQSAGLTFPVTELKASGRDVHYQITKTPIPPAATQPGWSATPPKSITEAEPGVYDYYAWVKDSQNRVSRFAVQTVDVATTRITVGPKGRDFTDFKAAIASVAAKGNPKGVVIEADAGEYPSWRKDGGFPQDSLNNIIKVSADNLTIRGVGVGSAPLAAGRAHLAYKSRGATSKDRWTIPPGGAQHGSVIVQTGRNFRLENIEISGGCDSNTMNGAGLWVEPAGVGTVLKNCFFHDNDNGILTSKISGARVVILNSEFFMNGSPGPADEGQNHNIYVGEVGELVFMFNWSHASFRGQLLKSRAGRNYVLYNRLTDEKDSNIAIDLPYGGESYIIGNAVQLSPTNRSQTVISYGREVVMFIHYKNGGPEPLKERDELTNARTGRLHLVRYVPNYGATGKWETSDRSNVCRLNITTEAERPDFQPGDKLTYGKGSSIEVVRAEWSWAGGRRDLYVASNTFVNQCAVGYGQYLVRAHADTAAALVKNNLMIDLKPAKNPYRLLPDASKTTKEKRITEENNRWCLSDPGLADIANYDYSLLPSAAVAIDKAIAPGVANDMSLAPIYQYVLERGSEPRPVVGELDLGAYECAATTQPQRKTPASAPAELPRTERKPAAASQPAPTVPKPVYPPAPSTTFSPLPSLATPQGPFRMNPRLTTLPDNTWLKMNPKFVYHPDQIAFLNKIGRKPAGFCHFKGEASLCYDASANQTIYFGGCTSGYGNNLWVYDCSNDVWTQIHPDTFKLRDDGVWRYREDPKVVPPGCCYYGMCYDSDRKVSVLCRPNGGATSWVPPEQPPNNYAWLYDASAHKWLFTKRNGVTPDVYITGVRWAYDPERKECVLAGGGVLWAYKTAANTWRKVNVQGPSAKPGNASSWAYMSQEKKFLLFKALKKTDAAGDTTWLYDPKEEKWENVTPKDSPPNRQSAAMCYDSTNNVAIMLAGWEEKPSVKFSDGTWVFDPREKAWTQMKLNPCPQVGGNCYQMSYDAVNNVAVYVTGGPAAETWVYRYKNAKH